MPLTRAQAKLKKIFETKNPVRLIDLSIEIEPLPENFDYSNTVSASEVERRMEKSKSKW